jgi:dienelactone hydrolase
VLKIEQRWIHKLKIIMAQLFYRKIKNYSGFLTKVFVALILLSLINPIYAQQQNNLNVITNHWLAYSDAPNSLYHYLTGEAYQMLDERSEKLKQIHTVDGWRKYQANMRQTLWNSIGPFGKKTSLNAKTTSVIKKDGYRIENVIYESLPSFYVTASLFIPDHIVKPAPAILFCTGHSGIAYRRELYQLPLLNLVKKGFVVLAFDPIGQGERLQYFDPAKGESVIGGSTVEHSYPSAQVSLLGKSIARYFIWDGIRGIDYLVSRKEVDPKRIGVHGLSGGGTQTAYISALDDRIVASAPAGYITSFTRLMESIGVQDGEQNLYHEISNGIDHPDFIIARAPKPTLIMATTEDFFSIQGARETYSKLKDIYTLFGKPDNIKITEDSGGHGYTKKNREAMYAFFQKHLQLPGSSTEEEVDFASPRELQKTLTGQLVNSLGGETVFSLNKKEAKKFIDQLEISRAHFPGYLTEVLHSAKKLSGYEEPKVIQSPVFTGRIERDGYVIEKYFVKGEGNYIIPYLLMVPDKPNNKALIYLHPSGKIAAVTENSEMEQFVKKGFTVLAPDLIGVGEMGPGIFKGDSNISLVSYNMWFTSLVVDKSIVGIRASDVVRLTRLLKKKNDIKEVYGIARKEMAPVLLYAAAFDKGIAEIALINAYSSYESMVMNQFYCPCFVQNLVPGALTAYDLPDLAASLAPRKLILEGTTDGDGKRTNQQNINKDIDVIKNAYHLRHADEQLIISEDEGNLSGVLSEWSK